MAVDLGAVELQIGTAAPQVLSTALTLLPDPMLSPMRVEATSDFLQWVPVGFATPRFEFVDPDPVVQG